MTVWVYLFIRLISIVVLPGHWFHWPADDEGADSAKQQSGKTPTDESRDHNFTVLTMLHFVGLINSPTPSISFLESAKPRQPTEHIPNKTIPQLLPLTALWHSSKEEYNYICFTLNFTKPMCHSFSTSYCENNDSFRAEEDTSNLFCVSSRGIHKMKMGHSWEVEADYCHPTAQLVWKL